MELLTVVEVSKMLKLSKSAVYDMASKGELPNLKIRGSIRFTEADILTYLESCRRGIAERKTRRFKSKHFS